MSLFFSYSMESPSIVAVIERPRRAFFYGVNVNHQFDSPDFIGHFPPAHMHLPGPFAFLGFVWLGIFRSLKQLSQGVLTRTSSLAEGIELSPSAAGGRIIT